MPSSQQPAETVDGSLPESASDRTKQEFEKLKLSNKELSEKLSQFEKQQPVNTSVLDEFRFDQPVVNSYTPAPVAGNEIQADNDGYVDMTLLNRTLEQAREDARKAQEEARKARESVEKFEETQVVAKAHELFPQLDPHGPSFDPKFYKLVHNELIGQMMKGKQDLIEAAKTVKNDFYTETAPTEPIQESREAIEKREQAALSTSSSSVKNQPIEHDQLVDSSRKGDSASIGQRLINSGY